MISTIRFAIRLTAGRGRPDSEPPVRAAVDRLSRESLRRRRPHHALNTPVGEPDPTEWPDPYDHRPDPRDPADPDGMPFGEAPHPHTGGRSTSAPHPSEDPEAVAWEGPKREKLDR